MPPLCRAAGLALALFTLSLADAGELNKCVDQRGRATYQDRPCPEGTRTRTIQRAAPDSPRTADTAASPAEAAPAGPAEDDDSADPAILALVAMQTSFDLCTHSSPTFEEQHHATLLAWRQAHAKQLARYEPSPRYQQLMRNGRRQIAEQLPMMVSVGAQFTQFCEHRFMAEMERVTHSAAAE